MNKGKHPEQQKKAKNYLQHIQTSFRLGLQQKSLITLKASKVFLYSLMVAAK